MTYMNTHEIAAAVMSTSPEARPNFQRAAETLANLAQWTDENSDGWAYWRKPSQASQRLQRLVYAAQFRDADCTAAEVAAVLVPVKAFLTRQGVDHADIIAEAVR